MKRKVVKSMFAILLVVSIFTVNIFSVYAVNMDSPKTEVSYTKYTRIEKTDTEIIRSMNSNSMIAMRQDMSKQRMTEHDQNIAILKELGFDDTTVNGMSAEDINRYFENALSISTTTIYMKKSSDGTTSIITEAECMAAVKEHEMTAKGNSEVVTVASNNDGWNAETLGDGYMRITVSSVYIDPASKGGETGWYDFHAWYEWLIIPRYRYLDAMSIYADECAWAQGNNATYSAQFYTTIENGYTENHSANKTTLDRNITTKGVFYEWLLPDDSNVNYIQYYIRGTGVVKQPEQKNNFNVYARYEHVYYIISITPSFSWDFVSSVPGVSFDATLTSYSDTFGTYNLTTYTP